MEVSALTFRSPCKATSGDALAEILYPLARKKVVGQSEQAAQQQSSLRDRAGRLLRSA